MVGTDLGALQDTTRNIPPTFLQGEKVDMTNVVLVRSGRGLGGGGVARRAAAAGMMRRGKHHDAE